LSSVLLPNIFFNKLDIFQSHDKSPVEIEGSEKFPSGPLSPLTRKQRHQKKKLLIPWSLLPSAKKTNPVIIMYHWLVYY